MDGESDKRIDGGALGDLIALESRLANRVADAEAEAERIVEAARSDASRLTDEAGGSFEAELAAQRASLERECDASIARIEAEARAEEERYVRVDDPLRVELARWITGRLVDGGRRA